MHHFELEKSVEMDFCRQTATEKAAGARYGTGKQNA